MTPIEHFVRLAQRGQHPAASSGQRQAAKIADVLVDEVPGLDGKALEGLCDFALFVKSCPQEARELLEE